MIRYLLVSSVAVVLTGIVAVPLQWQNAKTPQVFVEAPVVPKRTLPKMTRVVLPVIPQPAPEKAPDPTVVSVKKTKDLRTLYANRDFDVKKVQTQQAEVPCIHVASVPKDIKSADHPKKETFVQVVLPMILDVNNKVLKDRNRLLAFKKRMDAGEVLNPFERQWVQSQADKYRVKSGDMEKLLTHVDIVPPSLALGQSSVESGWLTSRAARELNSIFGHMATKKDVKAYGTLYASVESYVANINRHSAYKNLRAERAKMRKNGNNFCSLTLAKGLQRYSERGQAYIRQIQKMIRENNFKAFDEAQLES